MLNKKEREEDQKRNDWIQFDYCIEIMILIMLNKLIIENDIS